MFQVSSGFLDELVRTPGEHFNPPDLEFGAMAASLATSWAISLALFNVERCGEGTHIDLAIHDVLVSLMGSRLFAHLNSWNASSAEKTSNPGYHIYRCSDDKLLALGIGFEDHFWARLCRVLLLAPDIAVLDQRERRLRAQELIPIVAARIREAPRSRWQELFDSEGVPAAPVLGLSEVLEDPHVQFREMVQSMRLNGAQYVRQPLTISGMSATRPLSPAPGVGAHARHPWSERPWLSPGSARQ
jgi:crotonobetainyl-CoA:carnitine CoA-transferase CaiB-like acyl-CoA transferase